MIKQKHHEIKYFCTNGNYSYNEVLPKEKHIISKSETCLVESFNARLRHYIPSLRRRSMHYAKNRKAIERDVFLWINRKEIFNRYI